MYFVVSRFAFLYISFDLLNWIICSFNLVHCVKFVLGSIICKQNRVL
jgi:hypothetical protein